MGNQHTNTQSGDSKKEKNDKNKYIMTPEEEKKIKFDDCTVVSVDSKEFPKRENSIDFALTVIEPAPPIKEGQTTALEAGQVMEVYGAASISASGKPTIVRNGKVEEGKEVPKNPTLEASERRRKIEDSAVEKYEENTENAPSGSSERE